MNHGTTEEAAGKSKIGSGKGCGKVIQVDASQVEHHLGEMVRRSVEETLNGLLDAEADRLCNAGRYERSPAAKTPERATTLGSCTRRQAR